MEIIYSILFDTDNHDHLFDFSYITISFVKDEGMKGSLQQTDSNQDLLI